MASLNDISAGLASGIEASSMMVKIVVGVFLALALYNAVELIILIFSTFKKYHGLYFWSLLVSVVFGVIHHCWRSASFLLARYTLGTTDYLTH